MRVKQFALACLIIVAMAAGFAARSYVNQHDPFVQVQRTQELSRPLSAYATSTAPSDVGGRSDVDLRPLEVFYDALQHLRDDYVEPIQKPQERDLTYGALKLMLDSLHDPLTRFFDPEQAKIVQEAREGKFHGIGAVITVKQEKKDGLTEERLAILSSLPDSPARKAGLLRGDVITEIDGKSILPYDPFQRVEKLVKAARNGQLDAEKLRKLLDAENQRIKNGMGFQKAVDTLTSPGSKEYTLTIARPGVKNPLKIKVAAEDQTVVSATYATLGSSVGYIRLNLITKSAESKLDEALSDFKKRGLKGIVVDLRDSLGGDIESAQAVAGGFIPKKTLSILQLPRGKQRTLRADGAPEAGAWTDQVVILVNSGTSGVSEVLAAAIRDGAGAKLVGDKTFGNNLQQTFMPLRDGSAVTMTTGKYLTPKGADYRGKGLPVDIAAPAGGAKSGEDPQLAKAVETLTAGKVKG